ncbi:hypothetical protein KDH_27860 [Dictyobacter sp. S3.2.2.5]|nr:hypothetical protein KDH_27860 [Dictyobacter sp. S3.2.2.5]
MLLAKLEAVRSYLRKGTVIYADYVDDIVAPLRRAIEAMGLTAELYTGADKSGFEPLQAMKPGNVPIAGTKPVMFWKSRSDFITRLLADTCELCGSQRTVRFITCTNSLI